MTETVQPTKDSIETFHVYGEGFEDGAQFYALWVEHAGGFEYPVVECMTVGGRLLNSADPSFNTLSEQIEVHEEFYPSVAGNVARLAVEGAHVLDDCPAFMSDELSEVETWLAVEIVRCVGGDDFAESGIPFEIEEIIDRGVESLEAGIDDEEGAGGKS